MNYIRNTLIIDHYHKIQHAALLHIHQHNSNNQINFHQEINHKAVLKKGISVLYHLYKIIFHND